MPARAGYRRCHLPRLPSCRFVARRALGRSLFVQPFGAPPRLQTTSRLIPFSVGAFLGDELSVCLRFATHRQRDFVLRGYCREFRARREGASCAIVKRLNVVPPMRAS
jgi:hypothetical protein